RLHIGVAQRRPDILDPVGRRRDAHSVTSLCRCAWHSIVTSLTTVAPSAPSRPRRAFSSWPGKRLPCASRGPSGDRRDRRAAEPVAPEHVRRRHRPPAAGVDARLKLAATFETYTKSESDAPPSDVGAFVPP